MDIVLKLLLAQTYLEAPVTMATFPLRSSPLKPGPDIVVIAAADFVKGRRTVYDTKSDGCTKVREYVALKDDRPYDKSRYI